ncbi:hypothetical protein [Terrihabitans sp. B22-R8]|uniref:hypothetical protein n=1 Tax=Terrihabitans sp. B22-R8 TaxID=3425128 RepID=UPI00403C284F
MFRTMPWGMCVLSDIVKSEFDCIVMPQGVVGASRRGMSVPSWDRIPKQAGLFDQIFDDLV